MSDPLSDQRTRSEDNNGPGAEPLQRMATAFETYTSNQKSADAEHGKHNRKVLWWTCLATVGALAYTLITAVILIFSILSIQQTRRATHAANRAATAATRQAEVSEDSEKRQLRAYVYAKPPPQGVQDVVAGRSVTAVFAIRNSGQTPAYHVRMRGNAGVGPWPRPPGAPWREGPYGSEMVLSPETETSTGGRIASTGASDNLTQTEIDSVRDGRTHRIYLFGTITYHDAFDQPWYSDFCFAYYGNGPILTAMDYCDQHNGAN
jgi:hypothetical protein